MSDIFEDLFVLELANNHWGSVETGKEIIRQFGEIVKKHNIKAAMKFQVRDVDTFIHKDFLNTELDDEANAAPGSASRYIKKTLATKLSVDEFKELVEYSKEWGMVPMSTAFDENSVKICDDIGIEIMKIGSMNAISWPLIEKVVALGKPTIISNGGTPVEDLDDVVLRFEEAGVPLAINHCVSLYPSEDSDLELHQIDFLKKRYPRHTIGFSTHEYTDWTNSMLMSYAKGARTFERHIDIENDKPVSKYCSTPEQVDIWFTAFHKAKEMLGSEELKQRLITEKEQDYVYSVCRGMYAKRDLPKGFVITKDGLGSDFYLAIPLQSGQISERDLDSDITLTKDVAIDTPIKSGN